jgi:hypothetical protein
MLKLVLMSIMLASVVIPYRSSRAADLESGLRSVHKQMFVFILLWSVACLVAYAS